MPVKSDDWKDSLRSWRINPHAFASQQKERKRKRRPSNTQEHDQARDGGHTKPVARTALSRTNELGLTLVPAGDDGHTSTDESDGGDLPKHCYNMDTVSCAPLPTWPPTQQSFQLDRVRHPSAQSTASPPQIPRFYPQNSSRSPRTPAWSVLDENSTMPGPIRTAHERVAPFDPLAHHQPLQPTASSSTSAPQKQPPRPLNAWIIYRKDTLARLLEEDPENKKLPQSELSKKISTMWKSEREDIRAQYEYRANVKKAEHQREYPEYQFKPVKKVDRERAKEEKRLEKEREKEARLRAKQLNQQMRTGQIGTSPSRIPIMGTPGAPIPGMPTGSTPTQPSIGVTGGPTGPPPPNSDLHQLMLLRFGIAGPSPPVSEAPSPDGSPAIGGNASLGAAARVVSSSSSVAPSQDGRASVTSATTHGSPGASGSPGSGALAAPQPSLPLRPPSTSGWQAGLAMSQDASRAPSSAQPEALSWPQFSTPSVQPDQAQQAGAADSFVNDWMNPSMLGDDQNLMMNYNILSNSDLNLPWSFPGINDSDLQFGGGDATTQALLSGTHDPNIFALSMDTASFDAVPAGEIEVSTANPYAQQASSSASGFDPQVHDLESNDAHSFEALQSFLQSLGVNPVMDSSSNLFMDSSISGTLLPSEFKDSHANPYLADVPTDSSGGIDPRQILNSSIDNLYDAARDARAHGVHPVASEQPQTVHHGGLGSFAVPAYALPSPPESAPAISPADYQPTNLGASGSGSGVGSSHYKHCDYERQSENQSQRLATPQPTPPTSAGPQHEHEHQQGQIRPASISAYVPPAGAANATRRRAGASWRPPANFQQDDSDMS